MQVSNNITIHEFNSDGPPYIDDEGDVMLGFYFQFTDDDDGPVSDLIGPYLSKKAAEAAALKAHKTKDF